MARRWTRLVPMSLMVAGGFALAVGLVTPTALADKPGTLKISADSACTGAGMANDPKPGETFYVGGTNFELDEQIRVAIVLGTNDRGPVVYGPTGLFFPEGPDGTFCEGPITLTAGHYKAFAGPSAPENHDKTKVFKVTGVSTSEVPTVPTTEPPVVTTEPPTETTEPPTETTEPPTETTEPGPVVTTAAPSTSAEGGGVVPTTQKPGTTAVAGEAGALPTTGSGTTLVALGVALLLSGGVLELVQRRRPTG